MPRTDRLFQLIQVLRAAGRPRTGRSLADELEVSLRTLYRDVAALQSLRVPIEGAAGVGYVMRSGYDLPPLMFTRDEVEALTVGLALLRRTGDKELKAAAASALQKITQVTPPDVAGEPPLYVSDWAPPAAVDLRLLRAAIREETKLRLRYRDQAGQTSERIVQPFAIVFYAEIAVLAAWCELRDGLRHFRADRIEDCQRLNDGFAGEGERLRQAWLAERRRAVL